MSLKHRLVNSSSVSIDVNDKEIVWGSKFLLTNRPRDIRRKLDEVFPAIQEHHKVIAATIEGLLRNPSAYYGNYLERKYSFPSLAAYLNDGEYVHSANMSHHDQLMMALFITHDLARDLDDGIKNKVDRAGRALQQFDDEVVLLSVRMNINIDRIINHDLDLHKEWQPMIYGINDKIDYTVDQNKVANK
jgi:hypothetical protein